MVSHCAWKIILIRCSYITQDAQSKHHKRHSASATNTRGLFFSKISILWISYRTLLASVFPKGRTQHIQSLYLAEVLIIRLGLSTQRELVLTESSRSLMTSPSSLMLLFSTKSGRRRHCLLASQQSLVSEAQQTM